MHRILATLSVTVLILCQLPAQADSPALATHRLAAGEWVAFRIHAQPRSLVIASPRFVAGSGVSAVGTLLFDAARRETGGCFTVADRENRIRVGSHNLHRTTGSAATTSDCGVAAEETPGYLTFIVFVAGEGASATVKIEGPRSARVVARRTGKRAFVLGPAQFGLSRGVDASAGHAGSAGVVVADTASASMRVGPRFFGALLFDGDQGSLISRGPNGTRRGSEEILYAGAPAGLYRLRGEGLVCARAGTTSSRCPIVALGASVTLP